LTLKVPRLSGALPPLVGGPTEAGLRSALKDALEMGCGIGADRGELAPGDMLREVSVFFTTNKEVGLGLWILLIELLMYAL